ncbi:MAG TPA: sulfite exporter TauE/SafE family protein [Sphingobacteriaceae bacterium]|nr:sulfite exporter TauE/SafE family protein [Sphingobacteriaceae bacterium]
MPVKKLPIQPGIPVFINPGKLNILLIGNRTHNAELADRLKTQLPDAVLTHEKPGKENYKTLRLDNYHLIIVDDDDPEIQLKIHNNAISKCKFIETVGRPDLSNYHLNGAAIKQDNLPKSIAAKQEERKWIKVANWCLFALAFMIIGHSIFSYLSLDQVWKEVSTHIDDRFVWMLFAGFAAQLVDGALGMGYGVISTTVLIPTGLNPAAISGAIHTAEMFSSGASGYSHYRFGNVNKKLFKTLLIPGILGAIAGAVLLSYLGEQNSKWVRPVLSVYTLILGIRILSMAFKKKSPPKKVKRAGWLAGAGGFLDSFGGGGWGPLVTSTLISKGRTPRIVIGTVSLTEFFVTASSALTFFLMLGVSHIQAIAGLIIGGLLGAPLAARLAGRLPLKSMLIGVGIIIIFSSLRIFYKLIF